MYIALIFAVFFFVYSNANFEKQKKVSHTF